MRKTTNIKEEPSNKRVIIDLYSMIKVHPYKADSIKKAVKIVEEYDKKEKRHS